MIGGSATVSLHRQHANCSTRRRTTMRKGALLLVTIGLTWLSLIPSPAQAQPARTWVSGAGNDANPCSRLSPCKTFQGAHDKTAAGGEINCLDPGDFAPIQITKAITISCEAGTAGILGTVSVPIYVNAAPTDVVTLRGL